MVPGPLVRAVRAALFAIVCVGVGATLHSAADGCQVGVLAIGLGFVGISVIAYAGLGRERHGLTLTLGLSAAQVGLHYLFCVTSAPSHPMPMSGTAAAMPMSVPHTSMTAMLLAHAIAVVISGWWLGRGERDLFALCRAAAVAAAEPLRRLLAVAAALALGTPEPTPEPRTFPARRAIGLRPSGSPLLTSVTFRGPPIAA